jgi:hypothetical protein
MVCLNEVPRKIYGNGLCTPTYKQHLVHIPRFSPPTPFISSDFSVLFCNQTDSIKCRYIGEFGTTLYSTKRSGFPPIRNLLYVCLYLPQSTALQNFFGFLNFRSRHFVEYLRKGIGTTESLLLGRPPPTETQPTLQVGFKHTIAVLGRLGSVSTATLISTTVLPVQCSAVQFSSVPVPYTVGYETDVMRYFRIQLQL